MPRPDKQISHGKLDDPVSPSRSHSWSKYGEPVMTDEQHDTSSVLEVRVDDVTIIETVDESASKYEARATATHEIGVPASAEAAPSVAIVREWFIDRKIDGRTYSRTDRLVTVELAD